MSCLTVVVAEFAPQGYRIQNEILVRKRSRSIHENRVCWSDPQSHHKISAFGIRIDMFHEI